MNKNTIFVFVIGAPRSGTTWLHKMIAEQPDIYSLNGSNTFLQGYIFPLLKKYKNEKRIFKERNFTRGLPSKLNEKNWENLLQDFIYRFYSIIPDDYNFYVEKATDLTSEINKIKQYLPNSKFIHIIRDGRNETLSEIKLRKEYGAPFGIQDIYNGANRWKRQITEARIKSESFKSDYLEIYYESLFEETEYYLDKVFKFIGLPDNKETLTEICKLYSYKNNTVSMPTSQIANDQGGLINPYEKEMSKSEIAFFEYIAGDLLDSLGYKRAVYNRFFHNYIKYIYLPKYLIKLKIFKLYSLMKRLIFN